MAAAPRHHPAHPVPLNSQLTIEERPQPIHFSQITSAPRGHFEGHDATKFIAVHWVLGGVCPARRGEKPESREVRRQNVARAVHTARNDAQFEGPPPFEKPTAEYERLPTSGDFQPNDAPTILLDDVLDGLIRVPSDPDGDQVDEHWVLQPSCLQVLSRVPDVEVAALLASLQKSAPPKIGHSWTPCLPTEGGFLRRKSNGGGDGASDCRF